jgi:hypothetical protein
MKRIALALIIISTPLVLMVGALAIGALMFTRRFGST